MTSTALARAGTIKAARKRTPAAIALAEAMKGVRGRGRFPVSPKAERTVDGIVFDSKAEASRYALLKLRERIGEIRKLKIHPSWAVEIGGESFCRYSADFSCTDDRSGRFVIEELKSSGTAKDAAYRLRRKAAELAHSLKITEVVV